MPLVPALPRKNLGSPRRVGWFWKLLRKTGAAFLGEGAYPAGSGQVCGLKMFETGMNSKEPWLFYVFLALPFFPSHDRVEHIWLEPQPRALQKWPLRFASPTQMSSCWQTAFGSWCISQSKRRRGVGPSCQVSRRIMALCKMMHTHG